MLNLQELAESCVSLAILSRGYYCELVKQGFTEQEAFQIILTVQVSLFANTGGAKV